jgi:hypothetical protein
MPVGSTADKRWLNRRLREFVNLVHRRVEVCTDPGPAGYDSCQIFDTGQDVPVVIEGVVVGQIAVSDLLP